MKTLVLFVGDEDLTLLEPRVALQARIATAERAFAGEIEVPRCLLLGNPGAKLRKLGGCFTGRCLGGADKFRPRPEHHYVVVTDGGTAEQMGHVWKALSRQSDNFEIMKLPKTA